MPEILVHGRPATEDERNRSSMQLQKQATMAGWTAAIGYSQFQDDPKTYKSGQKAGMTIPGKIVDCVWTQGFKEGKIFTAVWLDNKLEYCLFNNVVVSVKELKEKLHE